MALFRRGAKDRTAQDETAAGVDAAEAVADPATPAVDLAQDPTPEPPAAPAVDRSSGPWDSGEEVPAGPRVDLGALRLPGVHGMELRMEIDKKSGTVTAVGVTIDGSTLQMQAFAAPRTDGIWDEIREEIGESVRKQGGAVDDVPGPFGRELLARLPVRTPEGRTGHRPARFVGVDGPRWFLRGVITGRAAVDEAAAAQLEDLFRRTVVVRGTEARAPRDLLALTLPDQAAAPKPPVEPAAPTFDPLQRGPEITEIR
ncbi:DUF3710 domain-containing protein [Cellulomonas pakistanensis]|uniref:DUF3710 domain-containing protein n=1 Tax=Cellulomonas pakistanensis TaxID=992287 RepID=A0A919PE14_9CELL|nr:DUF3710 domain-containing protein [Cellulomonas pakistanensis]GIG38058.1 hypothetical protein Cpa01nite_34390 [Cellulomonas pakistanensis]